jgi:hypothetical protein
MTAVQEGFVAFLPAAFCVLDPIKGIRRIFYRATAQTGGNCGASLDFRAEGSICNNRVVQKPQFLNNFR